jgi:sortase A
MFTINFKERVRPGLFARRTFTGEPSELKKIFLKSGASGQTAPSDGSGTTSAGRSRALRILRAGEIVLFGIGLIAVTWFGSAQVATATEQAALARELQAQAAALPARTLSIAPFTISRRSRVAPAPGALIGKVEIPSVGLSAPAREGTDARTLDRAVGHVPRTALPGERGNFVLAAHRDTFFRALKDIRVGDGVLITAPDGRHEYVINETRNVNPRDVWVLAPTPEPTLTLVTCYPFDYIGPAPKRFIVRAALAN